MDNQIFKFHKLNETGIDKAKQIQDIFTTTLRTLESLLPASRELSVVTTKLEEACFFAKKGMAVVRENQEPGFVDT